MSDAEHIEHEDVEDCVFDVDKTAAVGGATRSRCCNLTIRCIFSTPGLVVLVIVYSVVGALIFPLLEARHGGTGTGHHNHQAGGTSGLTMSISKSREDCLRELWTITERLNVLYERNWTMLVHEQLRRFEGSIVAATKGSANHHRLGTNAADSELIDPSTAAASTDGHSWSFKEALLYSVTVITTIGHGNMTPRTAVGKLVTMVYALFGVPLMLMCLSSLGGLLAEALQCAYCRVCQRSSRRNGLQMQENGGVDGSRSEKLALSNGCVTKKRLKTGPGSSYDELDCDGRGCKYDYMAIGGGVAEGAGGGSLSNHHQHNNSNNPGPYHQMSIAAGKPQVEEGNIYTGSPKHINVVPYQQTNTYNGYNLPSTATMQHQQQQQQQQHSGLYHPHPNSQPTLQMMYHPLDSGVPFGTLSKKFILAEMPIEYSQHHGQQQLQDAVTNESPPMFTQANLHNSSGNCVILLNPSTHNHSQPVVAMHNSQILGKSKFMAKPLPQEINLLIAESSEMDCQQQQHHQQHQMLSSMNYTPGTMEDEDDEDNRSCPPHGTPSRIPLIKRSAHNSPLKVSFSDSCKNSDDLVTRGDHQHSSYAKSLNRSSHGHVSKSVDDDGYGEFAAGGGEGGDEEEEEDDEPVLQVPMTLIFLILFCYISLGTSIFAVWEDWSVIDGAYFCFVTLSTIGFGDLVPIRTFHGSELQLFACFLYLLLGLVLVAMTFTVVENQLMWKCKRVAVRLKLTKP